MSQELKRDLAISLSRLHAHDVIHGDPRIDNVMMLNGTMKWIDFRVFDFVTMKMSRRRDVEILVDSVDGVVSYARAEIDAYVKDPTPDKLFRVLSK